MKPKDLLEHLDRTDRTDKHLFPKAKQQSSQENFMSQMFHNTYDQIMAMRVEELRRQLRLQQENIRMMGTNRIMVNSNPIGDGTNET